MSVVVFRGKVAGNEEIFGFMTAYEVPRGILLGGYIVLQVNLLKVALLSTIVIITGPIWN
jgi:hypothetical protein